MRIWSLHPKYLDAKGIVALWREALLAKHVLENKTKGYKHHPQLIRFKKVKFPTDAINQYLDGVWKESLQRGYNFDPAKISRPYKRIKINVTNGQVKFEFDHLMKKLKSRDPKLFSEFKELEKVELHPLFRIVNGEIEEWEII